MDSLRSRLERLERLEALEAIRRLVARHALAVDQRDIATLVGLYVADVAVPDGSSGREALASWFDSALRAYGVTFHLLGQHLIDLTDPTHATGIVYARPELEVDDRWMVLAAQYWDRYRCDAGEWLLIERETHAFYAADITEHPLRLDGRTSFPPEVHRAAIDLPERFSTWQDVRGTGAPVGTAEPRATS